MRPKEQELHEHPVDPSSATPAVMVFTTTTTLSAGTLTPPPPTSPSPVTLARAATVEKIAQIVASDPFTREGVAEYEVTEFVATTVADDVANLQKRA